MIIFVIAMKNYLLAILSGLLLSFAWPIDGFTYLIFFSFVPLFFIQKDLKESNKKSRLRFFFFSYLAFFIFNIITTYWVYFASPFGSIAAFILNSLFMALIMLFFYVSKQKLGSRIGYLSLIVFWISFEYLHLNWDLSWPWLTLGNCFSEALFLINWYEYTGVLGGTLWILFVNILFYELLISSNKIKSSFHFLLALVLPILLSLNISKNKSIDVEDYLNVVIVQPNIDPYYEKFQISYKDQLSEFIMLARTKIDSNTELLLGPETALQESIWESKVDYTESIETFKNLQEEFPKLNILVGATTFKLFKEGEQKTSTARQFRKEELWYDVYNSAIFISNKQKVSIYHKTKLVPGAEKIPFPYLLNNFSALSVDLGGVSGSLGSENSIEKFEVMDKKILPLICYESIYGDMNAGKNIDVISIITNDGWWGNTAGHKQHFSYSKLRAIEQKRAVVRSANTGISGFINPLGEVREIAKWDEKKVIKSQVAICNTVTFYNQFGDYIGRISSFISSIFILMILVKSKIQ